MEQHYTSALILQSSVGAQNDYIESNALATNWKSTYKHIYPFKKQRTTLSFNEKDQASIPIDRFDLIQNCHIRFKIQNNENCFFDPLTVFKIIDKI